MTLYKRNGGRETSTVNVSETQSYGPTVRKQAIVKRVSTAPIVYERGLPDGSVEVFGQPDGAQTFPREIFLTALKDPDGMRSPSPTTAARGWWPRPTRSDR